jgi:glycine oxidase
MVQISVIGAGIVGLWQALTLAKAGHQVTLSDRCAQPFAAAASRLAGAMLAPYCEGEAAEPVILELGLRSLSLWRNIHQGTICNGSLVIAHPRDQAELTRFARMTEEHTKLQPAELAALEPALSVHNTPALYYPREGHIDPYAAMEDILRQARQAGCNVVFGDGDTGEDAADWIVDCRGLGAADEFKEMRGVRGERLIVETNEIELSRPVRLLHPRSPIYVVPWSSGRFMIGATVIESEDRGRTTVRSALDLLSTAYSVHPAFGEARILDFDADVRPAFPDNVMSITVRGQRIFVNGLYRHGFLTAPALAEEVSHYIAGLPASQALINRWN